MKTRDAKHARSRDTAKVQELRPLDKKAIKRLDKAMLRKKKEQVRAQQRADKRRRQEMLTEIHRVLRDLLLSQTAMRRDIVEMLEQGKKNRHQLLLMSRLVARSVYDVRNGELTPLVPPDAKELRAMLEEAAKEPVIRDT